MRANQEIVMCQTPHKIVAIKILKVMQRQKRALLP